MNDVDTVILKGNPDHFASMAIFGPNFAAQKTNADSLGVRLQQAIDSDFEESLFLNPFIDYMSIFITGLVLGASAQ
jgi:hypothetical protein